MDPVTGLFTVAGCHDRRLPACPLPGMEERESLEMGKGLVYGFGQLLFAVDCLAVDEEYQHGLSGAVFVSVPLRRAMAPGPGN